MECNSFPKSFQEGVRTIIIVIVIFMKSIAKFLINLAIVNCINHIDALCDLLGATNGQAYWHSTVFWADDIPNTPKQQKDIVFSSWHHYQFFKIWISDALLCQKAAYPRFSVIFQSHVSHQFDCRLSISLAQATVMQDAWLCLSHHLHLLTYWGLGTGIIWDWSWLCTVIPCAPQLLSHDGQPVHPVFVIGHLWSLPLQTKVLPKTPLCVNFRADSTTTHKQGLAHFSLSWFWCSQKSEHP